MSHKFVYSLTMLENVIWQKLAHCIDIDWQSELFGVFAATRIRGR
jgi:hypothetical protein